MCALSAGACYFGKKQKVFKIVKAMKRLHEYSQYIIRNKCKDSKVTSNDIRFLVSKYRPTNVDGAIN